MRGCITMNLSKLFCETRVLYCFLPQSSTTEAQRMDKIWDTIFQKLLESGCTQSDICFSDQSGNHQFEDTHNKEELFPGMLRLRKGSPSMPDLRFTQMWKERLEHYRNISKRIEWNDTSMVFFSHFLGKQQTRSQHR